MTSIQHGNNIYWSEKMEKYISSPLNSQSYNHIFTSFFYDYSLAALTCIHWIPHSSIWLRLWTSVKTLPPSVSVGVHRSTWLNPVQIPMQVYKDHRPHVSDGAGGRRLLMHVLRGRDFNIDTHTHIPTGTCTPASTSVHTNTALHIYNTKSQSRRVYFILLLFEHGEYWKLVY